MAGITAGPHAGHAGLAVDPQALATNANDTVSAGITKVHAAVGEIAVVAQQAGSAAVQGIGNASLGAPGAPGAQPPSNNGSSKAASATSADARAALEIGAEAAAGESNSAPSPTPAAAAAAADSVARAAAGNGAVQEAAVAPQREELKPVTAFPPPRPDGAPAPVASPQGLSQALQHHPFGLHRPVLTTAAAAPSGMQHPPTDGEPSANAAHNGEQDGRPSAMPPPSRSASLPRASVDDKKPPPPPLGRVLSEAVKELKGEGVRTAAGVSGVMHRLRTRAPINITLDQVAQALFFGFLAFQLLLIKLLRPHPGWLVFFTLVGIAGGLAYSFLFYLNKKKKAEACDVLGLNLGTKGMHHLLGGLPSWLSMTEREKMDWLNAILVEVWPFYDKGVCKMVKTMTEGIFDNALKTMKVPGVKKVGFKQLTFGDAPFRVESIYVPEHSTDEVVLEVDVRWCGEANITLAIELLAGDFTKMCPKVTDITFVGSLRVVLRPMVEQIPGFGAAMVTFRRAPRVKYNLDFGSALGGKYAASVVKPFINTVIDNLIINSFVWPNRLVVPILTSEEMQIEVERMTYQAKGLLKVTVSQASGLRKTDVLGSADPLAELTTDGKHIVSTKCIKNKQNPVWDETFWLLVQEPHSQELKVSVYDKDLFSVKELLTLNIGDTFGAKELLGRLLVRLKPITSEEPNPVTKWYHLGEGDFSNPEGCGKGAGRIQLTCLYRSLESFKASELETAERGVVVVKVMMASDLPRGGNNDRPMSVYVRVRAGDQVGITPPVVSKTNVHSWKALQGAVQEFHGVPYSADVKFKLLERTLVADDEVGQLVLAVSDVVGASDVSPLTGNPEPGLMFRSFKLGEGDATLYASIRFVPYF